MKTRTQFLILSSAVVGSLWALNLDWNGVTKAGPKLAPIEMSGHPVSPPKDPVGTTGLADHSESKSRQAMQAAQQLADSDKLDSQIPLRTGVDGLEHPMLGFYDSEEAIVEDIESLCMLFAETDWIVNQTQWTTPYGTQEEVPYAYLLPSREPTSAERKLAEESILDINETIHFAAQECHALLDYYSGEYARTLEAIPFDQEVPVKELAQHLHEDDETEPSVYASLSIVRTGLRKFVVNFESNNFPELQASFSRLHGLQHERTRIVRASFL